MINEISEARWTRFSEMIKNLQDNKCNIREADVLQVAGSSRSIGRFHIARALVKKGEFKTVREAFEKMLGKDKPAYAPRYFPEVEEIVDVIHQAGGQAVLAHPKLVEDDSLVEIICTKIDFHGAASRFVNGLGDFTIEDELAKKLYDLGIKD